MYSNHKKFYIITFIVLGVVFSLALTSYAWTCEFDHSQIGGGLFIHDVNGTPHAVQTEKNSDGDGRLDVSGSGFFSKETSEMRALRKLYQNAAGSLYAKKGYYLFVVGSANASGEPDESLAVQGDMPRGKQFGYLFTSAGEDLSECSRRIVNARGEIRKVLATNEGGDYLMKYFDSDVNDVNLEEWFENARDFKLSKNLNFEVHHVIPINVFENNTKLQHLFRNTDFDINGLDNAIPLQKRSKRYDRNGHGNHPQYDRFIDSEINRILDSPRLNDTQKMDEVNKIISDMKNRLETDVLLGNKNVNDIINW